MRDGCTTESAVEGLEVGNSHEEKLKWHQREPSGRPPSLSRWQALDSASSVAAAYSVGRTEASAATNLLKSVSASTRNQLKELVRRCPTISIIRKHVNLEMSDNIRYQFNIVQYVYIYIYSIYINIQINSWSGFMGNHALSYTMGLQLAFSMWTTVGWLGLWVPGKSIWGTPRRPLTSCCAACEVILSRWHQRRESPGRSNS